MITEGNELFEFLDYSFNIEYMVAENEIVVVLAEKTVTAIHHYGGFPKGKSTSFMIFNSYRFKDGLIYTIDRISDDLKRNNDLNQTVLTTENNKVESYLDDLKAFGII